MTIIIANSCIGCGTCIPACPEGALDMGPEGKVIVNAAKCTVCGTCIGVCPVESLSLPANVKPTVTKAVEYTTPVEETVIEKEPSQLDTVNTQGEKVWVFVEQMKGKIAGVALELIGAATLLAKKLNSTVGVVLIGNQVECLVQELFEYGADNVFLMDHPVYEDYRTEAYLRAIEHLVHKYKPEVLLIGATTTGRDLAGAVATELRTGLTADCTQLDIDIEKQILLASRPAFGGNIMATILCEKHRPQMATVRPKVMQALEPVAGRTGILTKEYIEITEESIPKQILDIVKDQLDSVRLDEAKIIVSGGRGVKDNNGIDMLKKLADTLGGVVGGSRGLVECGCINVKQQVGQTGVTVGPTIYFAIGISGAIQHVVGMQHAEIIVAINTNPNCEMMKLANYSIEGDAFVIVPQLTQAFAAALANRPKADDASACAVVKENI